MKQERYLIDLILLSDNGNLFKTKTRNVAFTNLVIMRLKKLNMDQVIHTDGVHYTVNEYDAEKLDEIDKLLLSELPKGEDQPIEGALHYLFEHQTFIKDYINALCVYYKYDTKMTVPGLHAYKLDLNDTIKYLNKVVEEFDWETTEDDYTILYTMHLTKQAKKILNHDNLRKLEIQTKLHTNDDDFARIIVKCSDFAYRITEEQLVAKVF